MKLIFEKCPDIKITRKQPTKFFEFATLRTHFLFNGNYYDQIYGMAMGSPLGPVLAKLFLEYPWKKIWLEESKTCEVLLYRRYVDVIICLFACEKDVDEFFNFLNSCHPNRKSTFEKKKDIKIAFLDIRINKINQLLHKCVSEKYVNSFIYQFFEFNPFSYKIGLIKTLIHRTYAISCSWNLFHDETENTKHLLENYMYPPYLIDKQIKLFLNDKP